MVHCMIVCTRYHYNIIYFYCTTYSIHLKNVNFSKSKLLTNIVLAHNWETLILNIKPTDTMLFIISLRLLAWIDAQGAVGTECCV